MRVGTDVESLLRILTVGLKNTFKSTSSIFVLKYSVNCVDCERVVECLPIPPVPTY